MIQANTNNRWARLSQSEKAELLGIYASKGYHDLANIIAHYNSCGGKLYKDGGHREQNIGDKATINNKYYDVKRERPMYDYLRDNGLNSYQTAGLLGNLSVESYLKADLQQIGGPAYGLMQAEAGRQKAMRNYNDVPYQFGSNLTPEEQQQLDYIINKGIKEYTPGEWGRKGFKGAREARNAFLNVNNTKTATRIIRDNFLRPGKPHKERRDAMAEYFDEKMMSQFPYNTEKYSDEYLYDSGGKIHIDNYLDDGGPYGVIPLGGDYLSYLQSIPEIYGGDIEPSVVTAALPAKFNGSQEAARRYAEGYQKGAKPVSEAMNRAGQKIFNTVDTVVGLTPTPAGAITWLGHMGADVANEEYGKVGKDLAMAAAMGLGLKAIGKGATYLKNYWDEIGNFGEDTFRAFTDRVPGRVSTNFTYELPATRNAIEEAELAREFRMDQLGVDVPIRPTQNAEWSPEELARLRAMAGDHPMDLAAYTPEQIAQAQAQMQADAPIIHDALAGNRATGPVERFVSNGPVAGAKTSSGYQIERYPGYMLKSLLEGNPLEKQLSKSGEINIGNLRNYIKSKDIKAVDKAVMEKVLASEEFAGKKSIDYNKFRKAVQDELITYERTPDTRWENYGIERLGLHDLEEVTSHPDIRKRFDEFFDYNVTTDGLDNYYLRGDLNTKMSFNDLASFYFKEVDPMTIPLNTARPKTFTFSSSHIPNGSGKHYDPNTLGHSRTYTTFDEPDVLHVMESQSDWAQQSKRGKIAKDAEKAALEYKKDIDRANALFEENVDIEEKLTRGIRPDGTNIEYDYEYRDIREIIERNEQTRKSLLARAKKYDMAAHPDKYVQESYLQDNYTSRQIQENLRYAAEKGQTKMRYPTRETAAKIEGYPEREAYFNEKGEQIGNVGYEPQEVSEQRALLYTFGEEADKEIAELQSSVKKYDDLISKWSVIPPQDPIEDLIMRDSEKQWESYCSYLTWDLNRPSASFNDYQ